jgi:hypothetical protein
VIFIESNFYLDQNKIELRQEKKKGEITRNFLPSTNTWIRDGGYVDHSNTITQNRLFSRGQNELLFFFFFFFKV